MAKKIPRFLLISDSKEDNDFHKLLIRKVSERSKIKCFTDSCKALAYLESNLNNDPPVKHPDDNIVLLNINAPAINGFDMLEKIREVPDPFDRKSRMSIFLLTTYLNPGIREMILEKYGDLVKASYVQPLHTETVLKIMKPYLP